MDGEKLSLKEVQDCEFGLLCSAADYFDSRGISWFLGGGTLLGAIRHDGFIPWDDDIDIYVPRADYEKLKKLVKEGDYSHPYYQFRLPGDPGYGQPFIKMYDTRIRLEDETVNDAYAMDLNIDIFSLDHMPDSRFLLQWYLLKNKVQRAALVTKLLRTGLPRSKPEQLIAKALAALWGSCEKISLRIDRTAIKADRRYRRSQHATCGTWPENADDYYELEWIFPYQTHIFAGRMMNIPHDYDSFLRQYYGDYMTPPPEGERARHFFTAYRKQDTENN